MHGRQVDGHHFLAILALDFRGATEVLGGSIVTLGTPRNVVQVAHSVHHQDVHVCGTGFNDRWLGGGRKRLTRGQQEHVLDKGREHVVGFKVKERAEEVQPVSGEQGDGDVPEGFVVSN